MEHCGTQRIETNRLVLRRFRVEDASAMYKNWASDPEVTRYLTWPVHADVQVTEYLLGQWIRAYEDADVYQWAIVLKENGDHPIGSIAVVKKDEDVSMVQVGYCIGRNWWRRGITSEALAAVMDFLFDKVKAERIEARHDPRNPNSGAVMRKCGMKYEGTLRSADRNNQGICDVCFYSMLRSER